jgi:membrane-bound lytic murein transglycosylase B
VFGLHRVSSGKRAAQRAAPARTRFCLLAAVLVLPLTLNASEGFIATVSQSTSPRASAAPASPWLDAEAAAQYDALPQISRSNDKGRTVEVSSPKGTRTWSASSLTDNGLPSAARRAYVNAAETMAGIDPACQLPWTLLAGVGRVESDHGRYGGSLLGADGVSHPLIIGVALNGAGPVAAIPDSDDGRLDQDKVWDRAVGPMQFIPSTWAGAARDGDGDGVQSPNDIDDAALAAAEYLCSGSGSVLGESAMRAAIFSYNASEEYVALVMAMEEGYRTGVFIMPATVVDEPADRAKRHDRHGHKHKQRGDRPPRGPGNSSSPTADGQQSGGTAPSPHPPGGSTTTGGGGQGGGPKPPAPSPTPEPKEPKPSPKPPTTAELSGTLAPCESGSGWCLDGATLDLGGSTELEQKFEGLSGRAVTVVVKAGTNLVTEVRPEP